MPETRGCPIWRIWMADYKAAMAQARQELRENAETFRHATPRRNGFG